MIASPFVSRILSIKTLILRLIWQSLTRRPFMKGLMPRRGALPRMDIFEIWFLSAIKSLWKVQTALAMNQSVSLQTHQPIFHPAGTVPPVKGFPSLHPVYMIVSCSSWRQDETLLVSQIPSPWVSLGLASSKWLERQLSTASLPLLNRQLIRRHELIICKFALSYEAGFISVNYCSN